MDAKTLSDSGKQIVKAAEGGDPPSTLLQLLAPLQKFTATEDLLRQSKIGVAVNKLRQSKDPKVASLASQLINKWKADVKGGKQGKTGSPAPGARAVNGTAARDGTASPAPGNGAGKMEGVVKKEVPTSSPRQSKVPPEKRNAKADEVDTKTTGDPARDGCIELIYNGLAFLSTAPPDSILVVARSVEVAAYELYNNETNTAYRTKMRSLFQNLKMKGNEILRRDVYEGKIEAKRFVRMTSDELKNEERRREDKKVEEDNMKKAMTAVEQKAISKTMTCGKCGQSKVAYTQAQTRSADEPLTTFCECTNCGARWKFS